MSAKKTATYICIIILMLLSTAWVIYSNRKPSAPKPAAVILSTSQIGEAASIVTDMAKIKSNGGFDLSIFSSEKYLKLQKNVVIPEEQPITGKRDPFVASN